MSNPILDQVGVGGTDYDIQDRRGDNLALVDGYYEEMTVGDAEQLVATVGVNDKVPYLFRTSGGSADIGDREVDKLVGGSFPWNQKFPTKTASETGTNYTITSNNDGKFVVVLTDTVNGDSGNTTGISASAFIANHVYAWLGRTEKIKMRLKAYEKNTDTIFKPSTAQYNNVCFMFENATAGTYTIYPQLFDLTQLFGSTIADYIYSLESSTPGAGVAWFRKLFPKPYYQYCAGSMESVETDLHKMTGFNQWDEEWEQGYFNNDTGASVPGSSTIRTKNYIPVIPGTTYYAKSPNGVFPYLYDKNFNFLKQASGSAITGARITNNTFTIPDDAYYLKFSCPSDYGTTYKNDICINLHWDGERDGEYEPYVAHEYALSPVVLRGIPKLDSGNKLYYDGDRYKADGTVERRFAEITLDGEVTWHGTAQSGWYIQLDTMAKKTNYADAIRCGRFGTNGTNQTMPENTVSGYYDTTNQYPGQNWLYFKNTDFSSASDVKAYFASNPTTIIYELATPTTESADPYQTPQIVDDWGTEEYRDAKATAQTSPRDVSIPVGHDTTYRNNLRAKLEMAPESPSGDGDYILRQTSGQNEYVLLEKELPSLPSEDGTYTLKCTVSGSSKTLTWEADAE